MFTLNDLHFVCFIYVALFCQFSSNPPAPPPLPNVAASPPGAERYRSPPPPVPLATVWLLLTLDFTTSYLSYLLLFSDACLYYSHYRSWLLFPVRRMFQSWCIYMAGIMERAAVCEECCGHSLWRPEAWVYLWEGPHLPACACDYPWSLCAAVYFNSEPKKNSQLAPTLLSLSMYCVQTSIISNRLYQPSSDTSLSS